MELQAALTDAAVLEVLGQRLARHRIEAGLTQADLAEQAGIGKRTLERIEAGRGAELTNFIRVLRVLDRLEGLDRLLPELPPSPIAQLKLRGKQRQRVTRGRGASGPGTPTRSPGHSTPASSWTWDVAGANRPSGAQPKS